MSEYEMKQYILGLIDEIERAGFECPPIFSMDDRYAFILTEDELSDDINTLVSFLQDNVYIND